MSEVEAGRVGRPHGLDGSFHVLTRDPELLAVDSIVVAGIERTIVRRAGTDLRPIMRLDGIDTREAIDELRGEGLWVPRPPLGEDEYWADDLIGCEVVGFGKVTRMLDYPSCEILELEDGTLVPLVGDVIVSIDVPARRIVIKDGFLRAD